MPNTNEDPISEQNFLLKKYRSTGDLSYAEEVFEKNKAFAVFMAGKFYDKYRRYNIEKLELETLCMAGLWKAIHTFDPEKGASLTHYSRYYMDDNLYRFLNQSRSVRIPIKKFNLAVKINKEIEDYSEKKLKKPSIKYLAKKFGISDLTVVELLQALNIKFVEKLEDSNSVFENIAVPEKDQYLSDEEENKELLDTLINKLPQNEAFVIKARFGIGCEKLTLGQIGDQADLSKERIRQIQNKAIEKLKIFYKKHEESTLCH